ncbi:NAD(P)-dependent oxidoreductase [Actinopolyspora erythraea]|uniref:3-hydroxyisobutyrate dehydrogenase n=1 Tax=Actinopolyspora erythraea TaxID=414996 RepID=A0A099D656_9ACTN|nr:NAD(P)-dependent oxidoreductase [Actinopolyspora erythraea]ASU78729.1 NAD(P)-dependent oxidoreductase [Actinopolyspora erythraea]KGI81484.1 3-hydroxyisobutyrate dehydrogenase [Actinopolyspora erythraea]
MTRVAFLGTGTMGAPMVRNLLGSGFEVHVWNRTTAKAASLREDGAVLAETPASAAEGADVLVTMLLDGDSTVRAAGEALNSLPPDAVWLQMGTIGLSGMSEVVSACDGVSLVDAPVLGTRAPAEQGTLTILAAAVPEVRPRAEEVFDAVGQRTIWVSEDATTAAGTKLKLAANNWVLELTNAVGESLALAQNLGLDPNLFLEAIRGTATDSPYAHLKGSAILRDELAPSFTVSAAHKDAALVAEAAGDSLRLDLARAAKERFRRAEQAGYAEADMAAAYFASFPERHDG